MDISKQQCIEELDFTRIYAHVSDDEVQQGFLQWWEAREHCFVSISSIFKLIM